MTADYRVEKNEDEIRFCKNLLFLLVNLFVIFKSIHGPGSCEIYFSIYEMAQEWSAWMMEVAGAG